MGVAVTLALVFTPSGERASPPDMALHKELAALTARTAALEVAVERLTARRAAPSAGSARPRLSPPPAPPLIPQRRDQGEVLEPDEAFRRVGARDDYADALELVEELPDLVKGWVRVTSLTYKLDAPATEALLKAATKAAREFQPVGRDYLAGRIDQETLRARFWEAYNEINERLLATWSDEHLDRFSEAQAPALAHFEWLPALVGDRPQ